MLTAFPTWMMQVVKLFTGYPVWEHPLGQEMIAICCVKTHMECSIKCQCVCAVEVFVLQQMNNVLNDLSEVPCSL